MKAGERKAFPIQNGAAVIKEFGSPGFRQPVLAVVLPPICEGDAVYPSEHLTLGSDSMRDLYEALRWYYEDDDAAHAAERLERQR